MVQEDAVQALEGEPVAQSRRRQPAAPQCQFSWQVQDQQGSAFSASLALAKPCKAATHSPWSLAKRCCSADTAEPSRARSTSPRAQPLGAMA